MKQSNECPICTGAMRSMIAMPKLPMTEIYEPWSAEAFTPLMGIDQEFLYCEPCSHGKLLNVIPPEKLYGRGYRTATAKSIGASHSVNSFYEFLERKLDFSNYDVVLDIGGNDGSLLQWFPQKRRVAIDPNASAEKESGIECIKEFIEKADLSAFKKERKLVLCSHTLEHIERPESVLAKIASVLAYGDSCAFQFPSLESMVAQARLDLIHHQHVHYFSLRSISLLVARYGLEIVAHEFDDMHYGTLRIIFRRGLEELKGERIMNFQIRRAEDVFRQQMRALDTAVYRLKEPVGYGASLMLPLLAYWARSLEGLSVIFDEDETKAGLRWANLNVPIKPAIVLNHANVVVTAFNTKLAVRRIVTKLCEQGAANIVVPFNTL